MEFSAGFNDDQVYEPGRYAYRNVHRRRLSRQWSPRLRIPEELDGTACRNKISADLIEIRALLCGNVVLPTALTGAQILIRPPSQAPESLPADSSRSDGHRVPGWKRGSSQLRRAVNQRC